MRKLRKIDGSCAVVALFFVSKLSEDIVIDICKDHGFEVGRGMTDDEWKAAAGSLGIKLRSVPLSPMKLRRFLHDYPRGLYLVTTCNHLFAVEGGIIIDPNNLYHPGLDRIVKGAWRVVKKRL